MSIIIYIIIGGGAGILTGMGIGGGGIMIPLLMFCGIEVKNAQVINLICYIPLAIIGTISNYRRQMIDLNIWKKVVFYGIVGGIIGTIIREMISNDIISKFFGVLMIIVGICELVKGYKKNS